MTSKKVSLSELKNLVREAVALQLDKNKKETGAELRKKKEDDKAKNEQVVKVSLEQLRGMVKEAISARLKEGEYGTEFHAGDESSLAAVAGGMDAPEPVKSPEEIAAGYNKAMGTDPSMPGWEGRAAEDLEHAIKMMGRLGVTKQGRAVLGDRIKELEAMLNVPMASRHFAGDRAEEV